METNWKVLNLKRVASNGLVTEAVYVMNFELKEQKERHIGVLKLTGDETSDDFIPFEELTEEKVLEWVKAELGNEKIKKIQDSFEAILQAKIDKIENPEFLEGVAWD
jgi:hypothetical protein